MSQLSYQIPDNGRKKTLLRIPESHTLYLCPGSCGRRQGIRALKNGEADHASFLTFSQADIALGDYIGMVHDAVDEVLDAIEPTPRVITLYVNCIDDFIGTDGAALVEELGARHPGTRFLLSHINPVAADVRGNVAVDIHTNHYAALEPVRAEERDAGVNAVGGFVSVPDSCELRGYLKALGVPVLRELVACTAFDEYSALARSRFNIAVSHLGQDACQMMEKRLGIPWMYWPACYDPDELARRYEMLGLALSVPLFDNVTNEGAGEDTADTDSSRGIGAGTPGAAIDTGVSVRAAGTTTGAETTSSLYNGTLSTALRLDAAESLLVRARARADEATARALAAVGELPIVVDTCASLMPFSLALALIKAGFNVAAVFALHSKGNDTKAEEELMREHPEIVIVRKQGLEAMAELVIPRACVALGRDAAFLLRADHSPDMYHDEGLFGYEGIEKLMDSIAACMEHTERWDA